MTRAERNEAAPFPPRRSLSGIGRGGAVLSILLCAVVGACFALRPVDAAAVTYLPPWFWALVGFLPLLFGWRGRGTRLFKAALLLWAVFLVLFVEEPQYLLNVRLRPDPAFESARRQGKAIRVVSLNCAMGTVEAAEEVIPFRPDIVLLQEAPHDEELGRLAHRLYGRQGAFHSGPDGAILARGRVDPVPVPDEFRTRFAQAVVTLPGGFKTEAISLHLSTPDVRLDLWSPDCWRELAEMHRRQIREMDAVVGNVGSGRNTLPLILGGDFNAPAGDRVYRQIPLWYHDAFAENGRGWGDTILNDLPVHRIDQVWVSSDHFRADSVAAVKTRHSDHRMVVCDLYLREPDKIPE